MVFGLWSYLVVFFFPFYPLYIISPLTICIFFVITLASTNVYYSLGSLGIIWPPTFLTDLLYSSFIVIITMNFIPSMIIFFKEKSERI